MNAPTPIQIRDQANGELLATVIDGPELAAWWEQNEHNFFGVRFDGAVLEVAFMPRTKQ